MSETTIIFRGSVTDLATDVAHVLQAGQVSEFVNALIRKAPPPVPLEGTLEVEVGRVLIRVHCPHIKDGACVHCLSPVLAEYAAAKDAFERIVPLLDTMSEGVTDVSKWAKRVLKSKWTATPLSENREK